MEKKSRFKPKLHLKKGDTVLVIAGSSKGTVGEVLYVFPEENRAIVDGTRTLKRHLKATNNQQAGIYEKLPTIHMSNLMVVNPENNQPARSGRRKNSEGKSERYFKASKRKAVNQENNEEAK
jgi:large subunit ribosomal protein L24